MHFASIIGPNSSPDSAAIAAKAMAANRVMKEDLNYLIAVVDLVVDEYEFETLKN